MAVVRLSADLRANIEAMACNSFEARIETASKSLVVPMTGDEIYHHMFADTLNGMLALPSGYFRLSDSFTVDSVNEMSIFHGFTLSKPMPWPNKIPTMSHFKPSSNYLMSNLRVALCRTDTGLWDSLEVAFKNWHQHRNEVATARDQFVSGVRAILNNNTTLGAAIKQWPPLWDFIPQYAKDKHSQVVEKKKKEPTEKLKVDTASLTAIAAFNKMV